MYVYIVLVNWKLVKNATMHPVLFFSVLQPKIHHLSYSDVGMSTPGIKTTDRRINAFFHLKGDFTKKNVNLGTISAMHTTNRQGFK